VIGVAAKPTDTKRRAWAFRGISLAAGLLVTGFVTWRIGATPADLLALPLRAHLAAFAVLALEVGARGARIWALARGVGVPVRLATSIRAQLYADAAGAVTPSKIGSDPAKAWGLGTDGAPLGARAALLLGEMAWEVAVLVVVGGFLAVAVPSMRAVPLAVFGYAATVAVLGLLAVRAARTATASPPRWWRWFGLAQSRWDGVRAQGVDFLDHAGALRDGWMGSAPLALFATVVHMAARVGVLVVMLAVWTGLPEPWLPLLLWPFGLLYLGALLPPPGGGGGIEVGFAAALGGVLPPSVLAAALLWWRAYTFYLPAAVGGLLIAAGRRRADTTP
jgi:uncharacterized membrane protein YbhN (UPF0104 family)